MLGEVVQSCGIPSNDELVCFRQNPKQTRSAFEGMSTRDGRLVPKEFVRHRDRHGANVPGLWHMTFGHMG